LTVNFDSNFNKDSFRSPEQSLAQAASSFFSSASERFPFVDIKRREEVREVYPVRKFAK